MRILVTGGAGFIGSHTVDALLGEKHAVRILDNLQPRVHPHGAPSYLPSSAEFIKGDVRVKSDLERALDGMDAVFHLAAYQDYMPDFSTFFHVNAVSPALLLEIILEKKYPIKKIVFASSQAVYGEGKYSCGAHGAFFPLPRPLIQLQQGKWETVCPICGAVASWQQTDETAVSPHTSYAISKYTSELAFINLGKRYGIPTAGMRYSIVHGPRNSFFNAYSGICRIFSQRLLNNEQPIAFEDGLQLRDYINVADVVRANILALDDPRANWEVFNVGGERPVTVIEFARELARAFGKDIPPRLSNEFRVGDTRHTISDTSKLRKLGWKPLMPLGETLRQYAAWLKSQPAHDYAHYRSADSEMRESHVIRKAAGS